MIGAEIMMQSSLLAELRTVVGASQVSTEAGDLATHSYDWWPLAFKWRRQGKAPMSPEVVVRPAERSQVAALLSWANHHRIPITPWGGGSSVTGAPLAIRGGISIDLSQLKQTYELNEVNHTVRIGAGKKGNAIERELNDRGYTLNHSPQSLDKSTAGGWLSTRASGQFSSRWGSIEDLCVCFTVVLADGSVVETSNTPRAAVGPDIRHVFIGAEGTLGVITDVTLKIFPLADRRLLEGFHFSELDCGLHAIRQIMQSGLRPFLVRYYDTDESRHLMRDESFDQYVLLLGCEGLEAVASAEMQVAASICNKAGGNPVGPGSAERWMAHRFDFSMVENLLESEGGFAECIEISHFWDRIAQTYHDMKIALKPLADEVLGHFSHAYPQGTSLYLILLGHSRDDAGAEDALSAIWEAAMEVCLRNGAAISHHHGIGQVRRRYLQPYLESQLGIIRSIRKALDPNSIMNPGKL